MIVIYCSKYSAQLGDRIKIDGRDIPESVCRKATAMKHTRDAHHHVLGRLLLRRALERSGLAPSLVHFVQVAPEGRPYLPDSKIDFNISHSGDIVACAFSDECRVGVDVEAVVRIHFQDFENQFSQYEWDTIIQDRAPVTRFYEFWSRKEAVIKADGKGLQNDLATIDVSKDVTVLHGKTWFLVDVPVTEGYKMCLAAERPIKNCDIKIEWTEF